MKLKWRKAVIPTEHARSHQLAATPVFEYAVFYRTVPRRWRAYKEHLRFENLSSILGEFPTMRAAAQQALDIQRDPNSIATVFDVTDPHGNTTRVDLLGDVE